MSSIDTKRPWATDPNGLPPGTIQIIQEATERAETNAAGNSVILVPTPTNSTQDPLNWTKAYRTWVVFSLLLWTFLINAAIAWCSPAWAIWVEELDTNYVFLNYGQAILVLMCGIGVFLLQPLALKYGRRISYLIGSLLVIVGLLCGHFMTKVNLYFAYMTLAGLGSAPSYCTVVSSLLDVTFFHQRGRYISIYGLVLIGGNFLPPIATGFIVVSQGWQWCFKYLLIFIAFSTLGLLLTVEETSFPRATRLHNEVIDGQQVQGPTQSQEPPQTADKTYIKHTQGGAAIERVSSTKTTHEPLMRESRLPYLKRMSLYRPNDDVKAGYWQVVWSMFRVSLLPAPMWASLQLAVSTFVVGVVMTTQASYFAAPPYNFSVTQMGLMYLALLIGSLVGAFLGGPATDWLLLRLARRHGGMYEPENRLWAFVPVPFLAAGGVLLWGIGASRGLDWMVPCFGLFLIGAYLNVSLPLSLGYAFDSYPVLEDEVAQLSNTLRNVIGGVFTFVIQPWIDRSGARDTTIYIAVIVFVLHMTSISFLIWGKSIRVKFASRYYAICERLRVYQE